MAPPARPPAIGFIFVTVVLSVMGLGLIIPVLPGLITGFEGGNVGAGSHSYGWIVGVFALMQFIGSPFLGALSDRYGRRPVILIATAGASIDYVIMALAPSLAWLFVARIIAGLTAGVLSTANAYVADVAPPEKRAQHFGLLGAAFGLGFILGPMVGGLLGDIDLRLPFWAAAGFSALNLLYGAFMLPESLAPENRRAFEWRRANPIGALLALRQHPVVLGLAGTHFLHMISQMMLQSIWVLYTGHRYGWGPRLVGWSLSLVGIVAMLVQAGLVKPILRRLGETRGVVVGMSLSIVVQLGYGLAPQGWMIFVLLVFGAFAGLAGPALQSYISRHVPANEQGAVQGALFGLASVAGIVGPLIATWTFAAAIAPANSVQLPGISFFEGATLTAIALALAVRSFRKDAAAAAKHDPPAVEADLRRES